MSTQRFNYYDLLQVEQDATLESVVASYRALMKQEQANPQSDPSDVALLHEAFDVLSDTASRRTYDAELASEAAADAAADAAAASAPVAAPAPAASAPTASAPTPSAPTSSEPSWAESQRAPAALPEVSTKYCPTCGDDTPPELQDANSCCTRCGTQLPPDIPVPPRTKAVDRRTMPRFEKADWVKLFVNWPKDTVVIDARMRDLSVNGLSLYSGLELQVGHAIRVVGPTFDVVADVVTLRSVGSIFCLHARLRSLLRAESVDDGSGKPL